MLVLCLIYFLPYRGANEGSKKWKRMSTVANESMGRGLNPWTGAEWGGLTEKSLGSLSCPRQQLAWVIEAQGPLLSTHTQEAVARGGQFRKNCSQGRCQARLSPAGRSTAAAALPLACLYVTCKEDRWLLRNFKLQPLFSFSPPIPATSMNCSDDVHSSDKS